MSIDYRTLLIEQTPHGRRTADTILATRIPDLCPDCKGSGEVGDIPELRIPPVSCDHPNAPTIADRFARLEAIEARAAALGVSVDDLLRWGENVAKAQQDDDYGAVRLSDDLLRASAVGLLAALRTEAEQSGADR